MLGMLKAVEMRKKPILMVIREAHPRSSDSRCCDVRETQTFRLLHMSAWLSLDTNYRNKIQAKLENHQRNETICLSRRRYLVVLIPVI